MAKSIEDKYQTLTDLQHALKRPDMYIGSIRPEEVETYIFNNSFISKKTITYCPGLYKIFDEILVNASDHVERTKNSKQKATCIKVEINKEEGFISVKNNGRSIDVEIHKKANKYVPELIFGELRTSENFNDNEKRTTGGKNGYGAKLANIYSTKFIIELVDSTRNKKFKQTFTDNMQKRTKPKITDNTTQSYTKITFYPDFKRFGLEGFSDDMVNLMKKRVYDIAACTPKYVDIYLNKEKIKIKTFQQYSELYTKEKKLYDNPHPRWEIVLCSSEDSMKQVSFVNSIHTLNGGTHVDYIEKQITEHIYKHIQKKNKDLKIKKSFIKNYLFLFVKCLVENPDFGGQTKEILKSKSSNFGSQPKLSDDFLKKVLKMNIIDEVVKFAQFKENKDLKKTDGKKKNRINMGKLEDAQYAGTKKSKDCTLILTEGDSAASLAISGLSTEQRKYYGIFPLKGKMLNVRDVSLSKLSKNAEISNLKKILGLEQGKNYKNLNDLRYGKVMLLTDADVDGYHIKGLLFNVFHVLWPSLFKFPNFISSMFTPIVRAKKGNSLKTFYTLSEYENWKTNNDTKGWKIKYYKGLGTSTSKEAKEYFGNIDKNTQYYQFDNKSDSAMGLAFDKTKAEERKKWLMEYNKNNILERSKNVFHHDFIHKELVHFSNDDLGRNLPSLVDGLKISQRKILYCAFKRNLKQEVKVAQFSGYVSEHSSYHHGEKSLQDAIISMASNYVGSNNLNLLVGSGMFGTRYKGGKDSASPRYIFTYLNPVTNLIYNKHDNPLLNYLNDDGFPIEPEYYVPIIPMILVNGSIGIGTGFSTNIPSYNPLDIINNLVRKLKKKNMKMIHPWYKDFHGKIFSSDDGSYVTKGNYKIDGNTVCINELPIKMWTDKYKKHLDKLVEEQCIKYYDNISSTTKINISVKFDEDKLYELQQENKLEQVLKLTTTINTSNMYLFNEKGTIQKYNNVLEILESFYKIRLMYYEKRKNYQIETIKKELSLITLKIKFIEMILDNKLVVFRKKKQEIIEQLNNFNFSKIDNSFDYLLTMQIYSFTTEKLEEMKKQMNNKKLELDELQKKTITDLWIDDLNLLKNKIKSM